MPSQKQETKISTERVNDHIIIIRTTKGNTSSKKQTTPVDTRKQPSNRIFLND